MERGGDAMVKDCGEQVGGRETFVWGTPQTCRSPLSVGMILGKEESPYRLTPSPSTIQGKGGVVKGRVNKGRLAQTSLPQFEGE